jgi:excisionase family DNA binding protein
MNTTAPDQLLTIDQLCAWLQVHRSWVFARIADGVLPSIRLSADGRNGKRAARRFDRRKVAAWLERRTAGEE